MRAGRQRKQTTTTTRGVRVLKAIPRFWHTLFHSLGPKDEGCERHHRRNHLSLRDMHAGKAHNCVHTTAALRFCRAIDTGQYMHACMHAADHLRVSTGTVPCATHEWPSAFPGLRTRTICERELYRASVPRCRAGVQPDGTGGGPQDYFPWLVAIDVHPCEPHGPSGLTVAKAAGQGLGERGGRVVSESVRECQCM